MWQISELPEGTNSDIFVHPLSVFKMAQIPFCFSPRYATEQVVSHTVPSFITTNLPRTCFQSRGIGPACVSDKESQVRNPGRMPIRTLTSASPPIIMSRNSIIASVVAAPLHRPLSAAGTRRHRLEREGTLNNLTLTGAGTCCEGLKDPTKHVTRKSFDVIVEGPKADGFHKAKLGTDSMYPGHPCYAQTFG